MSRDSRRQGGGCAPTWTLTYADMISLLLVLFVFLYSLRVDSPEVRELRGARLADGVGWTFLARVTCRPGEGLDVEPSALSSHDLDTRVSARLVGGVCRVALVGQAPSREQAFRAARAVQESLVARQIAEDRFVLLAQRSPNPTNEHEALTVDIFATAGASNGE